MVPCPLCGGTFSSGACNGCGATFGNKLAEGSAAHEQAISNDKFLERRLLAEEQRQKDLPEIRRRLLGVMALVDHDYCESGACRHCRKLLAPDDLDPRKRDYRFDDYFHVLRSGNPPAPSWVREKTDLWSVEEDPWEKTSMGMAVSFDQRFSVYTYKCDAHDAVFIRNCSFCDGSDPFNFAQLLVEKGLSKLTPPHLSLDEFRWNEAAGERAREYARPER